MGIPWWWWACDAGPVEAPAEAPRSAVLRKPARADERWQNAVCNDGTAFSYVVRPGSEPVWVLHVEGGYFCDDERAACSGRARRFTTTVPGADGARSRLPVEGLFSLDPEANPSFAQAHHVLANYCSSDLWLGDQLVRRPTSGDPVNGWFFNGRENFRVLREALRERDGLDEADPGTKILVVGSSAGALGVVGNLDQLAAAFPTARADGRLKIVLEGGWIPSLPDGAQPANAAKWGPLGQACAAREADDWRCALGPSWWPDAAASGIPILVMNSALDTSQTENFGIDTPEERRAWRDGFRASLAPLPWVFSGGTPYHVLAFDPRYRQAREVVEAFWAGGPPQRVFFGYGP